MRIEITLESLTQSFVTVITTRIFEVGGTEFRTEPQATPYEHNEEGLEHLKAEVPEPFLSAILSMWGVAE